MTHGLALAQLMQAIYASMAEPSAPAAGAADHDAPAPALVACAAQVTRLPLRCQLLLLSPKRQTLLSILVRCLCTRAHITVCSPVTTPAKTAIAHI